MWKKYLALGAAVWVLTGVSMVSHAAETVSGGEPGQAETEVRGQEAEMSEMPVVEQAEVSAQSASGTYAASGTYLPYEGAKYSLTYEVRDNGVVITGIADYESKDDLGELVIPGEIDGVAVTEIGDRAFGFCYGLTGDLNIPEGVTTIGDSAFYFCEGLTGSLTIPGSVTEIGSHAFSSCGGLTGSLTIPEGVTTIGNNAFDHCGGLTGSLTLPGSVTEIGSHAFSSCEGLTGSLTIPEGVTTIGDYAFAYCSGLTGSLTLPGSVTEIGSHAFSSCKGLTGSLTIPEGVTTIGDNAFAYCSGLTGSLIIPESVTTIGSEAFKRCSGLTGSFDELKNVPSIWDGAFSGWSGLTGNLTIPESVTTIAEGAFSDCSGLTGDVETLKNAPSIWSGAFRGWSGLQGNLTIPDSVTTIGDNAFNGCSGLTGLTIGENVTTIGESAFSYCRGLTGDLIIPDNVKIVKDSAFFYCIGIRNVEISAGVDQLGDIFAYEHGYYVDDDIKTVTFWGKETIVPNAGLGAAFVCAYSDSVVGQLASGWDCVFIPLDAPEITECRVSTVAELQEAIGKRGEGSYRHIKLAAGTYYLPGELTLNRLVSVTLEAEYPGGAEILSSGVTFTQCSDVKILGCTLNGVNLINSYNITLDSCDLCGDYYGIRVAGDYDGICLSNCVIRDSGYGFCASNTSGHYSTDGDRNRQLKLKDCVISANGSSFGEYRAAVDAVGKFFFENCVFLNNHNKFFKNTEPDGQWQEKCQVELKDCSFYDNVWDGQTPKSYGICLNGITWQIVENTLKIGYPLQVDENTTLESAKGTVRCLSDTSLPWKNYRNLDMAEGIQCQIGLLPYEGAKYHLRYQAQDKGMVITGIADYESKEDLGALVIPGEINGVAVVEINYGVFSGCSGLTGELVIPNGVKKIGSSAFSGCSGLTGNLTISNSVTEIESSAFSKCSGLTGNLTIPNSVKKIGSSAFSGCSGLTGNLMIPNSVTEIGSSVFYGCSGLTGNLTIPNSVKKIGSNAFSGCSGLTGNLTIPNSVKKIGSSAFSGCSGLTGNLTIPNSVTEIGSQAFYGCSGLTGELVIPNNVTKIGSRAFSGCKGLTGKMETLKNAPSIWEGAFSGWSGLTGNLTIPNSVKKIGSNAFSGCSGLTGNLTIPDSVTEIGISAFSGCSGLTGSLTISDSVTEIGGYAFSGCTGLTGSLTIPDSVIKIGHCAFGYCTGLTGNLTIPDSVTEIGDAAFQYCTGLTGNLMIPSSVTTIGIRAFEGCNGLTGSFEALKNTPSIWDGAFAGWSGLTGELIIPDSVTEIGSRAFYGCSGLTGNVTIPDNVTVIGENAFWACSGIRNIIVSPGVGQLGNIFQINEIHNLYYFYGGGSREVTVLGKQTEIPYGLSKAFVHAYSDSVVAREAPNWNYTLILIDAPEITERRVTTVEELLDAVGSAGEGSYQRIVLADGVYNITDTIALDRAVSVTIEAEHPGKAKIHMRDAVKPVISVSQCMDVKITGCILENESEPEQEVMVKDLVQVQNSHDVQVKLYGQSVTSSTAETDTNLSVAMTAEEQKSFVADLTAREGITGKEAMVEITVSDAEGTLTEQEKSKVAQTAAEGGLQIGRYLDISMSLQAGASTRAITHTDTPVRLVLEVPAALRQADLVFFVIRLHDGKVDLLRDLDSDPDTVTIETDYFSSYTMVYKEKTGSGGVISGTVKSFGDTSQGALVQLLDGGGNVIAQTTAAAGSSGTYELEGTASGEFTLTVSKAGHVTRSYAVILDGESLELSAEIRLKGDVNGDGKADSLDKRMIFGHIAGSSNLTGYEFQVGDVDGSGRIDALDKRMLYGHIAGTSPMW